jgi:hypothetical protein
MANLRSLSSCLLAGASLLLGACAEQASSGDPPRSGLGTDDASLDGAGSGGTIITIDSGLLNTDAGPLICDPCTDFPKDPLTDPLLPDAASLFQSDAGGGPAPCILEPPDGALFPSNWSRLRIRAKSPASAFQITVHAKREQNDLVVYQSSLSDGWIMPKALWQALAAHVVDEDITITVKAKNASGPLGVAKSVVRIAPVTAGGSMVFWGSPNTSGEGTALYGFSPGDDGIITALKPIQVQAMSVGDDGKPKGGYWGVGDGQFRCVGCHAATPDGQAVTINDHWTWNIGVASIKEGSVGQQPSYVTPLGAAIASLPIQGVSTFSKAHWDTGKRWYISSLAPRDVTSTTPADLWLKCIGGLDCRTTNRDGLAWIDLAAGPDAGVPTMADAGVTPAMQAAVGSAYGTGWGYLARDGDPRGAVFPKWSHDGTTVFYTSTDSTQEGRVGKPTACDIYSVPFNGGKGGAAKPVDGAALTDVAEYYPDVSADDRWVAYTRSDTALPGGEIYYREDGEIWIVPAAGGTAERLKANDPPSCSGDVSPGSHNSWPKWSPMVRTDDKKTKAYYFLVFSSSRDAPFQLDTTKPASQLFLTAIVEDLASHKITTYPAIYIWNQQNLVVSSDAGVPTVTKILSNNVTPAWNEFDMPPVPPADIR